MGSVALFQLAESSIFAGSYITQKIAMKKLLTAAAAAAFIVQAPASSAQDKLKEGKITFEISINNAEEMNDQMLAMMPKEMVVYFKDGKSRGEMDMMGGKIISITDSKAGETISCMDMMGKKQAIKTTKEDAEKEKAKMGDYDVKITDETRDIAGYNCRKAVITFKDKQEKEGTVDIWFTKELEASNSEKYSWKGIDGYMMEFSVDQRGMGMKFTCTEVKKQAVSDDLFKVPEGYTVMTQEEMMKQFGGSGN
jgi:GLPGLI family protein